MVRKIAGRPAVITGAASGIGRSLAQRLSRHGSPVVIADVNEAGLRETADSLTGPVLIGVLGLKRLVTGASGQAASWPATSIRKARRARSTPACSCRSRPSRRPARASSGTLAS